MKNVFLPAYVYKIINLFSLPNQLYSKRDNLIILRTFVRILTDINIKPCYAPLTTADIRYYYAQNAKFTQFSSLSLLAIRFKQ